VGKTPKKEEVVHWFKVSVVYTSSRELQWCVTCPGPYIVEKAALFVMFQFTVHEMMSSSCEHSSKMWDQMKTS
jgi:hypothetical protein